MARGTSAPRGFEVVEPSEGRMLAQAGPGAGWVHSGTRWVVLLVGRRLLGPCRGFSPVSSHGFYTFLFLSPFTF